MHREFGEGRERMPRLRDEAVYQRMYAESLRDPDVFWARMARELRWLEPWETVLDSSDPGRSRWFVGGQLNAAHVCLDQHVDLLEGGRRALAFRGDDGEQRALTYTELHVEVVRLANALTALGVAAGARVGVHLPHTPEWVIALLACARIGAIHVVFDPRAAAAQLCERLLDSGARTVITADGGFAEGRPYDVKAVLETALLAAPEVRDVVVVRRTGRHVPWVAGRDRWFHELVSEVADSDTPRAFPAEQPLSITYGDGGVSDPRGLVHSTGGFLLASYLSAQYHLDLGDGDLLAWHGGTLGTAALAYGVYGALASGSTVQFRESAPDATLRATWLQELAQSRPSVAWVPRRELAPFVASGSLDGEAAAGATARRRGPAPWRVLAVEGGPCTPAERDRARECLGRCVWVDGWGSDATGTWVLAPLSGLDAFGVASSLRPFFGIDPRVVDDRGREVASGVVGHLVLARPWPGFAVSEWGDPDGFVARHWGRYGGGHFAPGVRAHRDADGELSIDGTTRR